MPFGRPKLARTKRAKIVRKKSERRAAILTPQARTKMDGAIVRPVFTRADLINAESEIGRGIFGPIPEGHQREFFELERNVWVWHESWEENGQPRGTTMRYEVRPGGVYKKLQGSEKNYVALKGQELENFRQALRIYLRLVKEKLY